MRIVQLQQICEIQIGKTPSRSVPDYWDGNLPWVAISDLSTNRTVAVTKEKITQLGVKKSGSKLIPKGTLLLSFKLSLGKRAFAGCDLFTNEAIASLQILDSAIIDCKYLYWALGMIDYERLVDRAAKGKTLNKAKLRVLPIPLPPLDEQKRIAGILDAADTLRTKRRESLAQLDILLQSTFLDMFGDPVTNPMGWEIKPLGEIGTLDRGVSKHRPRNDPLLLGGLHPLIQTGDVSNSEGYIRTYTSTYSDLGLKQSKKWPARTLCITIAANIANTGLLTFDACFPDSVVGFRSQEMGRVEYVQGLFWFFKDILERTAPQVAQKNINLKILRDLPVPIPPLDLQRCFAAIVECVERQKARQRTHLAELDTLFASLQQRAFNGEL